MQSINASDLTFLNMDRPTNLMVVNGLTWFDEEPDWDAVQEVLQERLIDRFPVLHRRPARVDGTWVWEDDPEFDLDRHIRHVTLGGTGDLLAAQAYVSERVSQPLDRQHPLWELDILGGLAGEGDQPKAIILSRFHHSLADGIRLVQLVLSLFDAAPGATPPTVGRTKSGQGSVTRAVGVSKQLAGDVVDFAANVGSAAASAVVHAPQQAVNAPNRVVSLGRDAFEQGFDFRVSPTSLTDAVTDLSSEDNQLVNSWRSASRLALAGTRPDLTGDGSPGVDKRVSWVTGLDVAAVKAVGAAHEATINDVLLAVVSRALSAYVEEKDRQLVDDVSWLVPISLKPIDMNLPTDLGNYFAMVLFPMPLGVTDDDALMAEIRSRMARTKNSAEAMMVFGLQRVVAEAPSAVGVGVTEFVANKTVGVLTNVPGPRAPMYLAGTEVTGMLGWVPTAADQGLGICIFSYNGQVSIGISSDARLMPDPERLAELMKVEFAALAG
jgi:diacylglycerol O-acyltransferase / wax synthase